MNNTKPVTEYFLFLINASLRAILFFIIAKFFNSEDFIKFSYLVITLDLIISLANSSTLNFLIHHNKKFNINIYVGELIIALPISSIFFYFVSTDLEYILYLLLLLFIRLLILLITRFYLTQNNIIQSLKYDFWGNSFWIFFVILLFIFNYKLSVINIFQIWITSSSIVLFLFFKLTNSKIRLNLSEINEFLKFFFKNFHFSYLYANFKTIENFFILSFFYPQQLLVTYILLNKMVNFSVDLSLNFIITKRWAGVQYMFINILSVALVLCLLFYFVYNIDYVQKTLNIFFEGKISYEYDNILPFILLIALLYFLLRLIFISLIKKKLFKIIFISSLIIYLPFLIIILTDLSHNIFYFYILESFALLFTIVFLKKYEDKI